MLHGEESGREIKREQMCTMWGVLGEMEQEIFVYHIRWSLCFERLSSHILVFVCSLQRCLVGRETHKCEIRELIMFDYDFHVDYGLQDTGYQRGIRLNSSNRKLTLEALSLF